MVGGHDKKLRFEKNSVEINATQVVIVLMGSIDHHTGLETDEMSIKLLKSSAKLLRQRQRLKSTFVKN